MSTNERFFVYRPVVGESLEKLSAVQQEYTAIPSFNPVDALHMTLIGGNNSRTIPLNQRGKILKRAPETAAEPLNFDVESVEAGARYGFLSQVAIRLFLNDSDTRTYQAEHSHFINAANNIEGVTTLRPSSPHVTIGYLDEWHALDSITDPIQDLVGSTIEFGPAMSPSAPDTRIPEKTKRTPRSQRLREITPHEIIRVNPKQPTTVNAPRAVTPGSIPSGLLAAMRGTKSSN